MLQVSYIRDNREQVLERLAVKNFKQPELVDEIISLDTERKRLQTASEELQAKANASAKQIGELMRAGKKDEANALKSNTGTWKEEAKRLGEELSALEESLQQNGEMPVLPESAIPHWELAAKYNLIDFELGVKITGAGFPVYKGKGAKLQRALIAFFLDEAEKAGYSEVMLPLLVNEASGFGTGQLPDKEGQMYYVGVDNLYLIPTAEVPITNLYRDVILKADELPVMNCGYTPCFRREAGSYGAHVRGLNRLHQFDKVEIVQVVHPDQSYEILEQMSGHIQGLLQKLGLPYRVLRLCGGDMGFTSALTYDMETWSAAQQRWLEVSSVSNFETYQSNRLKLRFRNAEGKTQLAHTLNGSALALPRIVATLLENNQTENGIKIPEVLVPYTKFEWIN
jgi:seryl-tRNA synthetase